MIFDDTITAIATPPGSGAIAVIRLSGNKSFRILKKIFYPKKKNAKFNAYSILFGTIKDGEEIIDEVLVSFFKSPHSYTGEDSIEISCHGSIFIQQKILNLLIDSGARLAEPGEFTQRAYLNGKMDLSQAEAVADLIASESKSAHKIAMQQMRGGFSHDLKLLREKLIYFASLIELELDFSEEDVEFADRTQLFELINEIIEKIDRLSNSFKLGNAVKSGINVVIIGRPNAGKSTLLNKILNDERAIVTDIPGTTRDTLEEVINIRGIKFRFIDTAGLRNTNDKIEKIGVKRALEQVKKASVYIYLFDSNSLSVNEIKKDLKELPDDKLRLIAANKTDLASDKKISELNNSDLDSYSDAGQLIFISAKKNEGIHLLEKVLFSILNLDEIYSNETIVADTRHYRALENAKSYLNNVKNGLESQISGDLLAIDIRSSLHELGTITGEISVDKDILGTIFGKFCIGK